METKDILKALRKNRNYSAKEVAVGCDMSLGVYQKYESGERGVGTPALCKLADFYGVTTDYLLGRPEAKLQKNPIDEFARAERIKELEKIIIKEYLELGDEEREAVLDFIHNCIKKEEERKSAQRTYIVQRAAREDPTAPVVKTIEVTAEEVQRDQEKPLEDWDL